MFVEKEYENEDKWNVKIDNINVKNFKWYEKRFIRLNVKNKINLIKNKSKLKIFNINIV